jgi:hypothetical protein
MRDYFASLGDSAHPESSDPRARAITRFQELLLVSFREFSVITDETILSERKRFRAEIIHGIETFAKRGAVRNLKSLGSFNKEQANLIYDALYKAMCVVPLFAPQLPTAAPAPPAPPHSLKTTTEGQEEKPETRIGLRTFQHFLSEIATWARDEKIVTNGFQASDIIYIDLKRLSNSVDNSNGSIVKWQSMSSSTDCFISGIHHAVELCHSRLVLHLFFFHTVKLIECRTWFLV